MEAQLEMVSVASQETRYEILTVLSDEQSFVPLAEISERVSVHKSTTYEHLQKLDEVGLIEKSERETENQAEPSILYKISRDGEEIVG